MLTLRYSVTKKHAFFLIFFASLDPVVNFRVRLQDVNCGNNEVIFSQVQQLNKNKCHKRNVTGKQKVQF